MARILVVDDENIVRTLVHEIGTRLGHEVFQAANIAQGLTLGAHGVDVVLLDVLLPDGNGLQRIREFAALPGQPELVIITGHGDGEAAEMALRSGAWEYLDKPLRVQELSQSLTHVLAYRAGRPPAEHLPIEKTHLVGNSPSLLAALRQLQEAANSDVNVLLLGETGVGKELFAKALYRNSLRAGLPFVTIDCASLPETLIESHLFGHTRGAFTGADRAKDGLLLAADRGTLFLDEIGDLPLSMQGVFLRALELRRFRPVGQIQEVPSNFRLVAATNRNLDDMVRSHRFRGDLLYRLKGITIHIPPLRERIDDIPELAKHAVLRFCVQHDIAPKIITQGCLEILLAYAWPGNVRELIHALERACVAASDSDSIFVGHLPTDIRIAVTKTRMNRGTITAECGASEDVFSFDDTVVPTFKEWKQKTEMAYVQKLLKICHGDVRKAAQMAGLSRGHLYELLKKYGDKESAATIIAE